MWVVQHKKGQCPNIPTKYKLLRTLINPYIIGWDIWIPQVKCALNSQINSVTGETPHYIIFGENKVLPYELLDCARKPMYNHDDFISNRIIRFQAIHQRVEEHMKSYSEDIKKTAA